MFNILDARLKFSKDFKCKDFFHRNTVVNISKIFFENARIIKFKNTFRSNFCYNITNAIQKIYDSKYIKKEAFKKKNMYNSFILSININHYRAYR